MRGEARERVRDILLQNRLFFPTRLGFNDPFDCRIPLSWDGATLDEMERKLLDVYRRNPPKGWNGSIEEFVREQRANGSIAELARSNLGPIVTERRLDNLRVLCLCERPDDILMWSHYASNHEGICLEFNVIKESYFSGAVRVIYADDYPKLKVTMGTKELANGMVLTKAKHWAYESEWRVLCVDEPGLQDFPKECLSGVILGCKISEENRKPIREWLSQRATFATLYSAVKSQDKFAVRIENTEDIGPPVM